MGVLLSDGKHLGGINRIVVDPATGQIIDLVVHKRRLFHEDRVVPLGAVVRTDGGSLVLEQRYSAHNLSRSVGRATSRTATVHTAKV
jgi:sporulation protein YlmC with PRC-barrel domain